MALTQELIERIKNDCQEIKEIRNVVLGELGLDLGPRAVDEIALVLYQNYYLEDQGFNLDAQNENLARDPNLGPVLQVSPELQNLEALKASMRKKE